MVFTCCLNLSASIKCFIKLGFGDCVNCYNLLSILKDFDKVYVFNSDFQGVEKQILKEYFGIEGDVKTQTSDSLYRSFGHENMTVLSFTNDNVPLLKFPMMDIDKWLPTIRMLNFRASMSEVPVSLDKFWHDQCQVRLNDSGEILVLDPLLHKVSKLDKYGNLLQTFSSNHEFIENVYKVKFGENNKVLTSFYHIREALGNKSSAINFNSISINNGDVYILITSRYFIVESRDTILTSFNSMVKLNDKFDNTIFNVQSEIENEYFNGQSYFHVQNDSIVLFDVISVNPINKNFVISENKIKANSVEFVRFYDDTIPVNLVDKRLNYRVTSFIQDSGYLAYCMFSRIYKNSKALLNLKLFVGYKFNMEFPNPKNYITGIKKDKDLLSISYKLDSMHHVAFYNLKACNFFPPFYSVPEKNLATFLQLDSMGSIYYVNNERKLIKIKI